MFRTCSAGAFSSDRRQLTCLTGGGGHVREDDIPASKHRFDKFLLKVQNDNIDDWFDLDNSE